MIVRDAAIAETVPDLGPREPQRHRGFINNLNWDGNGGEKVREAVGETQRVDVARMTYVLSKKIVLTAGRKQKKDECEREIPSR